MLGWTILFAVMSFSGAVPILAGHPTAAFSKDGERSFRGSFSDQCADARGSRPGPLMSLRTSA